MRLLNALFGPTGRLVFVLVISAKPDREDLVRADELGPQPYKKIAVYSSLQRAMEFAASEAGIEYFKLKGFPDGGFPTAEENASWEPLREAAKQRAAAAKHAMLNPVSWRRYETTDGKVVWVYEGPVALDYRIISNRVDVWS